MIIRLVIFWLALLLIPVGFYFNSTPLMWIAAVLAFVLSVVTGISRCDSCGERVHLHMQGGITAKLKIGLPLGRCDHCGESYLRYRRSDLLNVAINIKSTAQ